MVRQVVESRMEGKIRCDACPVMCYIADGRAGACDRYANEGGELVRLDPFTVLEAAKDGDGQVVPFLEVSAGEWDGEIRVGPGQEARVYVEVANSSAVSATFEGHFEDA